MQSKLPDGSVMICGGISRDAELKYVGEKHTPQCKVGVAVGKRNDQTIWCNVTAWRGLAQVLSSASKGDSVFVIGHMGSHEYNGKTYTELNADFVSVAVVSDSAPVHSESPAQAPFSPVTEDGPDDLPF